MANVTFFEQGGVDDSLLHIAVIISTYRGEWIFGRQKGRATWEAPAGHREQGESIEQAARRELYEETGALEYDLYPICPYSVTQDGETGYGMLFYADVKKLGPLPGFEIEESWPFAGVPEELTYPDIQPVFLHKVEQLLEQGQLGKPLGQ